MITISIFQRVCCSSNNVKNYEHELLPEQETAVIEAFSYDKSGEKSEHMNNSYGGSSPNQTFKGNF